MLTMWDRTVVQMIENTFRAEGETNIDNVTIEMIERICKNRKDRMIIFKEALYNILQEVKSENGEKIYEELNNKLAQ